MTYGTPREPVAFDAAFEREDDAANLSRAAALLLLRSQLRGDDVAFKARAEAFRRAAEPIPEEDLSRLAVPRLSGKGLRVPSQPLRDRLVRRFGEELREGPGAREAVVDLARRLQREPTAVAAAELAEAALAHPDELTRVAAAAARLEVTTATSSSSQTVEANDLTIPGSPRMFSPLVQPFGDSPPGCLE